MRQGWLYRFNQGFYLQFIKALVRKRIDLSISIRLLIDLKYDFGDTWFVTGTLADSNTQWRIVTIDGVDVAVGMVNNSIHYINTKRHFFVEDNEYLLASYLTPEVKREIAIALYKLCGMLVREHPEYEDTEVKGEERCDSHD